MEKVSAVSLMKNMYGICIPVECDIQLIFHRRRKMGGGRGQGGGGAGGGCLDIFTLILSFLFLPLFGRWPDIDSCYIIIVRPIICVTDYFRVCRVVASRLTIRLISMYIPEINMSQRAETQNQPIVCCIVKDSSISFFGLLISDAI